LTTAHDAEGTQAAPFIIKGLSTIMESTPASDQRKRQQQTILAH